MAVKLRLTRMGAKKKPTYRIVATDSRRLEDKFVRIVLNGECPASWEVLVNDFKNTMEEEGSQTGTFWKNSVEKHFSDFSKFVALCTVYPGLEKYYELHDIKEYASMKERTRLIYD